MDTNIKEIIKLDKSRNFDLTAENKAELIKYFNLQNYNCNFAIVDRFYYFYAENSPFEVRIGNYFEKINIDMLIKAVTLFKRIFK